jgi:hypothetical protein
MMLLLWPSRSSFALPTTGVVPVVNFALCDDVDIALEAQAKICASDDTAAVLRVSRKTVEAHIKSACVKTQCNQQDTSNSSSGLLRID